MKNKIKNGWIILLLMLCSCGTPTINEKYAATVAKDALSLPEPVVTQTLHGGHSGAQNFKVAAGQKKYVIRFLNNESPKDRDQQIRYFKVASDGGYGPHLYYTDTSRGIVIMEYLPGKKVTYQDFQSDQLYVALAHLLQKIHRGQAFEDSSFDVFKRIARGIQINKKAYNVYIPLEKIEHVITVIHQALLPHLITTVPCHNDLHGGNLMFLGNEFKAIDYDDAGQGDPHFDVATVTNSVKFLCKPVHEKLLFATYLDRQPTDKEKAKLYLFKQVVWIKWAMDALDRLRDFPATVHQYGTLHAPTLAEVSKENIEGTIDLNKPVDNLKLLKAMLTYVFDNFESQEFHHAITLLKK